jgi:hypothetical protein
VNLPLKGDVSCHSGEALAEGIQVCEHSALIGWKELGDGDHDRV